MGTELSPFTTGTVSVDTSGNITVSGYFWDTAYQYDELNVIGVGVTYLNADVVFPYTSAVAAVWPVAWGAVSGASYILRRNSYKRSVADTAFAEQNAMVRLMRTGLLGFSDTDPPDPQVGLNGQWMGYIAAPNIKMYKKIAGAWVFQFNIATS